MARARLPVGFRLQSRAWCEAFKFILYYATEDYNS